MFNEAQPVLKIAINNRAAEQNIVRILISFTTLDQQGRARVGRGVLKWVMTKPAISPTTPVVQDSAEKL